VLAREARPHQQLRVDRHRTPVVHEQLAGDRRKPVPRREQAARFVERRGDQPAVDESGARLVTLVELEVRLVLR
jgi:hypothetical protein